jgi:oligopeptidase A
MSNPLLAASDRDDAIPPFDRITAAAVEAGIGSLLDELEAKLPEVEKNIEPTWVSAVEQLDEAWDPIGRAWGAVSHLHGVRNTPELRDAYQAAQPRVIMTSLQWSQSEPLFKAVKALRESDDWDTLNEAQQRIIDKRLRDARLAGIELEGAERERFNEIQQQLSELATNFSNHVLDATKAFSLELTDAADVAGLPQSALDVYAQAARAAGSEDASAEQGPWRVTLDAPSFVPFMKHALRRELREQLYRAYVTRASDGELDNQPLMDSILTLRAEKAKLLGYGSYAELSLASKMAPGVDAIGELLTDLHKASVGAAEQDLEDLRALAAEGVEGAPADGDVQHWDIEFLAERLRERRFAFTDEELRPYFALPRVLDGLFALVKRIFGVEVEAADGQAPVWHDDVHFFRVFDESGAPIAAFYLDPYSRPADKRGGAWMDECVVRKRASTDDKPRLPVAYLCCNQTPPVGDTPSLMTFREVETLFHEFGHGLQHMLTRIDYPDASGINGIEWDAVELPSQFMENWCYHRATLLGLAKHWQTGETLPDELFEKLKQARTYRSGWQMLRQIHYARTDLHLHHAYTPGADSSPFDAERRIAKDTLVVQPLPEDRFLCGFTHIFAGGYAAGYYSYKWAEVLSADAFGAFEDVGVDDDDATAEVGKRFRETILALGGARHPMVVFKAFRGREPSTEALLRHSGLLDKKAA